MAATQQSTPGYAPEFVADVLREALDAAGPVFAIAGLQGTGKSTLSAQVAALAAEQGRKVVALSIDDFYLGREARQRLGREIHPLCATRGAPGTHDVALACDVLDALSSGREAALPRFDKIADDRLPESEWPVERADLVVLEGWFLKVPPQPAEELADPLLAGLPPTFTAFVGHKEACRSLPPRATLLASSAACPVQMFRVRSHVYATQFHPELDLPGILHRVAAYRYSGYFAPDELDDVVARLGTVPVEKPHQILANFVRRYAR